MSRTELGVWRILLAVAVAPALILLALPDGVMLVLTWLIIGLLLELFIPIAAYTALAFGVSLATARLPILPRILITIAVLGGIAFGIPRGLNTGVDAEVARLRAADRPTPAIPLRTLAFYSADPTRTDRAWPCDDTCQSLLLSHRVARVAYAEGPQAGAAGWTDIATVSYVLTRDDCRTGALPEAPDNNLYNFVRDRHFRLTGECLTRTTGRLSDADVIVLGDRPAEPPSDTIRNLSRSQTYVRNSGGYVPGGQYSYFSVERFAPVWLPYRPVAMSGSVKRIDLFRLRDWRLKPKGAAWLTDLAVPLAPAVAPDLAALRARIITALDAGAPVDAATLRGLRDYLGLLGAYVPDASYDPVYPRTDGPEDKALVARIGADIRFSGWTAHPYQGDGRLLNNARLATATR